VEELIARKAIENLCVRLLPGGVVILTVLNACRLVKQFRSISPETVINTPICTIERRFDIENVPTFGAEYTFLLQGAVEGAGSTGLPEYLIHPAVLTSLFEECGCTLVETMPFHRYYHDTLQNYPQSKRLFYDLLSRYGFENADMTQDEWNVISYYSFYVFRKGGVPAPMPDRPIPGEPKGVFVVKDVPSGEERVVTVQPKSKERDGRARGDKYGL
jgi:hypothetical protein